MEPLLRTRSVIRQEEDFEPISRPHSESTATTARYILLDLANEFSRSHSSENLLPVITFQTFGIVGI